MQTFMKKLMLMALVFPSLAFADAIFNVYDEYYATLPDRLFKEKFIEFSFFALEGDKDQGLAYFWEGTLDGREYKIIVREGNDNDKLLINGHVINYKKIRTFPGDTGTIKLTGMGEKPVAYFAPGWLCMQWPYPGLATIGYSVYLIKLAKTKGGKPIIWSLPDLHGSCKQVRMESNQIKFYKAEYRHLNDVPIGVSFHEYTIRGKKFVRTKSPVCNATFVVPEKDFKFSLGQSCLAQHKKDQK
jgi:hypothetical protein